MKANPEMSRLSTNILALYFIYFNLLRENPFKDYVTRECFVLAVRSDSSPTRYKMSPFVFSTINIEFKR